MTTPEVTVSAPPDTIPGVRVEVQYYCKAETDEGLHRAMFNVTYMLKAGGAGLSSEAVSKIAAVLHALAEEKIGRMVEPMSDIEVIEYDAVLAAQQESLEYRAKKGAFDA